VCWLRSDRSTSHSCRTATFNLFSLHWIPFYIYALALLDRGAERWRIACAAAIAALVVLSDWYWASICGVLTIVWMAARFAAVRERLILARHYALFAIGTLILLAPFLAGMLMRRDVLPIGHQARDAILEAYVYNSSVDLFGLFFPNVYQPLWGAQVEQWMRPVAEYFAPSVWYVPAGWTLMRWRLSARETVWRRERHLAFTAIVLWVLAMGPGLHILGKDTGIPMPYALLDRLPLFGTARKPALFIAPVLMVMSIAAAQGLAQLRRGTPDVWRMLPIAGAVSGRVVRTLAAAGARLPAAGAPGGVRTDCSASGRRRRPAARCARNEPHLTESDGPRSTDHRRVYCAATGIRQLPYAAVARHRDDASIAAR
jgi:hypothetical protein